MHLTSLVVLLAAAIPALHAADAAPPKVVIDPLELRWTFGNHEPIPMYRRIGKGSTGGIQGSALWLKEWHNWFDSEANTRLMKDLGLNILHSRFYKGMGWDYESKDFPNVKRFVENCHKHGVRVLAYVQFSTLYYEIMQAEVPDLAGWAAVDENGRKYTYGSGSYFRWLPCVNTPAFEEYLKKVVRIALTDGGFDGIMYDNCFVPACHCQRCVKLFREYLKRLPNPEDRFGIPTVDYVVPPPARKPAYAEIQDPIEQQWVEFRCQRVGDLFRRMYRYAKSCKPSAIVSGNIAAIRRANMAGGAGVDMGNLDGGFDLFVSQSGNAPGYADGCIVNRIREMKLARVLDTPILALSDGDAGRDDYGAKGDELTLVEDAVFGGIPTDRTVIKADREMVSPKTLAVHRPLLQRFNQMVRAGREGLRAPSYEPVKVLYSRESIMFSEKAYQAVLSAEEILLRNHVPYGLLPTSARRPLEIPSSCELLLVCDQRCLSTAQVEALVRFARRGGKVIVTGESGGWDELYRQRKENPLTQGLKGCSSARQRPEVDMAPVKSGGWTIKVASPGESGRRLMQDINAAWTPPLRVQTAATTLAEVKRTGNATYVHLVNYAREPVAQGARIEFSAKGMEGAECTFAAPMENRPATPVTAKAGRAGWSTIEVPAFSEYAVISVKKK